MAIPKELLDTKKILEQDIIKSASGLKDRESVALTADLIRLYQDLLITFREIYGVDLKTLAE